VGGVVGVWGTRITFAILSLYNQSKSCVCILDTRSSSFTVFTLAGLLLVTDPVCDFHGQDLKA